MDIEALKKSMVVLVDTREKSNFHIVSRLQEKGINWKPYKLDFADYSFLVIPPHGQEVTFECHVAVERKKDLTEFAMNVGLKRTQFENEFKKAQATGAKIHILIEDANGRERIKIRREEDRLKKQGVPYKAKKTWRSFLSANSMIGSIVAWKERYGIEIDFISKTKSCDYMLDVFYKAIEDYFMDEKEMISNESVTEC